MSNNPSIKNLIPYLLRSLLSGMAVTLMLSAPLQSHAVEIITHPSNDTRELPISTLRSIFSNRMTRWPDGTPIRVFVMGEKDPLHSQFCKQILGVFPHQLRRAWNRMIYSGTGQEPTRVDNELEMYSRVQSTPGAIGYLSDRQENEKIRIIEIE